MLITETVFRLSEVVEQGITDIHYGCLADFACNLEQSIGENLENEFTTGYYESFKERYGTKISYNSKNIVFTKGISTDPSTYENEVERYCAQTFDLEEKEDAVPKYSFTESKSNRIREVLGEEFDKKLPRFNELFGRGEFPYINIVIVRIGNKDHSFYTIHR